MLERSWRSEIDSFLSDSEENNITLNESTEAENFNLVTPRSRCSNCLTQISSLQNIPVISYLLLKGECGACKAPISARYPAVELITAVMTGLVAWALFAFPIAAMAAILLTWCLIALTGIDYDTYLLPDNITLPLVWLGLIANHFGLFVDLTDALWGAIGGYMVLWTVFWIFKIVTGKEGMGYGDFKLLAALGAWLGWQMLPVIIVLSSLVGAIVGITLIILKKQDKSKPIPLSLIHI